MKEQLFSGKPEFLGGLSNEKELANLCPDEFKTLNPWSDWALKLFFHGGKTTNWKWRSTEKSEQTQQLKCLKGLLSGWELEHNIKKAVAGWMLSEMFIEIPSKEK